MADRNSLSGQDEVNENYKRSWHHSYIHTSFIWKDQKCGDRSQGSTDGHSYWLTNFKDLMACLIGLPSKRFRDWNCRLVLRLNTNFLDTTLARQIISITFTYHSVHVWKGFLREPLLSDLSVFTKEGQFKFSLIAWTTAESTSFGNWILGSHTSISTRLFSFF